MIETLIQELGDICHQHYQGSVREDGKDLYQYDTEAIWMLDTPEAKEIIKKYFEKLIADIPGEIDFSNPEMDKVHIKQQLRDKWL